MVETRILLFRDQGIFQRLIQWQTRSQYNHAAIQVGDCIVEATAPVVRYMPFRKPALTIIIDLPEETAAEMLSWLHLQIGKPYDYAMVARFVTRQQESRKSKGKWFCSELAYATYCHAGIDLFRDTEPWEVSPGLLARTTLGRVQEIS